MTGRTRRIALVFLLAAAVYVAGCGGSSKTTSSQTPGSTASSATVAATSTTTSSATGAPTSGSTAGPVGSAYEQYKAQVTTVNACHDKVYGQLAELPQADQDTALSLIGQWLNCLQTFQDALSHIQFPASVSSQVSALSAADQAWIAALQNLIANPNSDTVKAAQDAGTASATAAANLQVVFHSQ